MKKVLVVDDQEEIRRLLKTMLEARNFLVRQACDGIEALDAATDWQPDLIFMDIEMPNLDGVESCKILKGAAETRKIPVVLVSALEQIEVRDRALEAGADDYICKPFSLREVLQVANNPDLSKAHARMSAKATF